MQHIENLAGTFKVVVIMYACNTLET